VRLLISKRMDKNVLRTFIYFLTIVSLVSSITVLSLYSASLALAKNASIALMKTRAESINDELERLLNGIQSQIFTLSINEKVNRIVNYSSYSGTEKISLIFNAPKDLRKIQVQMPDILNTLIVHYPDEKIILDQFTLIGEAYYSGKLLRVEEISEVGLYGYKMLASTNNGIERLYMVQRLLPQHGHGYILADLDLYKIIALLDKLQQYDNEKMIVFFHDDPLFVKSAEEIEFMPQLDFNNQFNDYLINFSGTRHFLEKTGENRYGLSFALLIPQVNALSTMQRLKSTLLYLLIATAIFGLLSSTLITLNAYQPINRLSKRFSLNVKDIPSNDSIKRLESTIMHIISDNDQLRDYAQNALPVMREKQLLELVMNQSFLDEDIIIEKMDSLGISFYEERFRVVVLAIENQIYKSDIAELFSGEVLKQFINNIILKTRIEWIVRMGPYRFFLILNYDHYPFEAMKCDLIQLLNMFNQNYQLEFFAGVSKEKRELKQLSQALLEAMQIESYVQNLVSGHIGFYDNLSISDAEMIVYPFVNDEAIQFAIKSCDPLRLEQSLAQFELFLRENCAPSELSIRRICFTLCNNIYQNMIGLDRSTGDIQDSVSSAFSQLISSNGVSEHLNVIRNLAFQALELYREHNYSLKQRLDGQVSGELALDFKRYVEINYNHQLSVSSVSESLHVSIASLYRALRETYGITPANMINEVRIDKASELLRTTNLSVAEIMVKCGFETKQSFYRQFKKRFNCSPLLYRARHIKTNVQNS
jgi:AraC-like DNA-binding protein